MFIYKRSRFFFVFYLVLSGCIRQQDFQLNEKIDFLVIGHKGSGTQGLYGNTFRDNSIDGILNALSELDGSECDIQMSNDSTLWLFHDHMIFTCEGDWVNINALSDDQINEINICNYEYGISTLKDLVLRLKTIDSTYISFDLKILQNPLALDKFNGEVELAKLVSLNLNKELEGLSNSKIFIEVPFEKQVSIFEQYPKYHTFLIHKSFEYLRDSVIHNHSDPIHHFYNEIPQLYRKQNKKSMLWVVNSAEDMMNALKLKPEIIQTDNIPMANFFKKLNLRGKLVGKFTTQDNESQSNFLSLYEDVFPIQEDYLLEVDFGSNKFEGTQLVMSSFNEKEDSNKWLSIPIYRQKHYFFIGKDEHQQLQSKKIKFYLWNQNGSTIEIIGAINSSKIIIRG